MRKWHLESKFRYETWQCAILGGYMFNKSQDVLIPFTIYRWTDLQTVSMIDKYILHYNKNLQELVDI